MLMFSVCVISQGIFISFCLIATVFNIQLFVFITCIEMILLGTEHFRAEQLAASCNTWKFVATDLFQVYSTIFRYKSKACVCGGARGGGVF